MGRGFGHLAVGELPHTCVHHAQTVRSRAQLAALPSPATLENPSQAQAIVHDGWGEGHWAAACGDLARCARRARVLALGVLAYGRKTETAIIIEVGRVFRRGLPAVVERFVALLEHGHAFNIGLVEISLGNRPNCSTCLATNRRHRVLFLLVKPRW